MKKILLATTALVATAGMAAAEVKLSGLGRFGVLYIENAVPETRLESRFRLTIDGSTEADGGIKFGARLRIQSDDAGTDSSVGLVNSPRFTVSSGGLTLGVGNILGAIDTNGEVYAGGQFGLSGLNWANVVSNFGSDTYSSAGRGRNGVEVIYSVGDFTAHLSNSTKGLDRTEIVLAYKLQGFTIAAGYNDSSRANDVEWTLGGSGSFGNVGVAAAVAEDQEGQLSAALAASYKIGAATKVGAFVALDDNFKGRAGRDEVAYGLEVEHSLGGGATLVGGFSTDHGINRADLGVTFNF